MRIVITSIYRPGDETGTARISEELSLELSRRHDVLYFCLGKRYQKLKVNDKLTYLQIPSVFAGKGYVPAITPITVRKVFRDLKMFSPEVVHAQNIVFNALIALAWANKNSIPFILTFHSLPTEGVRYVFPKLSKSEVASTLDFKLSSKYIKAFVEKTNAVIALNKPVEKSIKSLKTKVPVYRIRNGLYLGEFFSLKPKMPKTKVVFTFVGSYIPRKNQEHLIKTFQYTPPHYQLNLYGNKKTGGKYLVRLENLIKKVRADNIKLHDFVDRKGLLKALAATDYFLSTSLKEVQSLVIIESLASGTPVIGLKNETLQELVGENCGLVVDKNIKPGEFAQVLRNFVTSHRKDYYSMAVSCQKRVEDFSIEFVVREIIKVYQKTISSSQFKDKKKSQIYDLIPKKLENLFSQVLSKRERKRSFFISALLSITVIVSLVTAPFIKIKLTQRKVFQRKNRH